MNYKNAFVQCASVYNHFDGVELVDHVDIHEK